MSGVRLKKEARYLDAIDVADLNSRLASGGDKSGQAEAHNDSVFSSYVNRVFEVVLTRLKQEMITLSKLGIDGFSRVLVTGNVDVLKGHSLSIVIAGRRTNLVPLNVWHLEEVLVVLKDDVRLLGNDRRRLDLADGETAGFLVDSTVRIGLITLVANENHVPDAALPAVLEVVVPCHVLLLRARGGLATDSAIGYVASTCVASLLVRREVLEQVEVALDL